MTYPVGNVIPYATQTSTRRNVDVLRRHGWRLLLSPVGRRHGGWNTHGMKYGLDNGAWSAHQAGRPFDEDAFCAAVDELGDAADWIVVPDVVCGGAESMRLSTAWLPRLEHVGPLLLFPVQDGFSSDDVRQLVGPRVGIFVGGSTEFKEQTLPVWAQICRERQAHLHVGRVNTVRRIRLCSLAGADSFDGSSATRYSVNVRRLTGAVRQTSMQFDRNKEAEET